MTIVPPYIAPVDPFLGLGVAFPKTVLFAYQEGEQMHEFVERLRKYVVELSPYIDGSTAKLIEAFVNEVNKVITNTNTAMVEFAADNAAAMVEFAADNAAAMDGFVTEFNEIVQSIINSSITVSDPVMTGVATNLTSAFRVLLNTLYASKATQSAVESGRLTQIALDNAYATKSTQATVDTGRLSLKEVQAKADDTRKVATAAFTGQVGGSAAPHADNGSTMIGVPGVNLRGTSTMVLAIDKVTYHPFEVTEPLGVSSFAAEITVAPSAGCYLSVAIYSVDGFWQPFKLMQSTQAIVSAVGGVSAGFSSYPTLPRGRYVIAVAAEKAMTLRGYLGGPTFATGSPSANLSQYFSADRAYKVAWDQIAPRWTSAPGATTGAVTPVLLDWTAQAPAIDSMFLLPNRQVVKGVNIVLHGESWNNFWTVWDWNNHIKWQVDNAKSVGANTIRVIGEPTGIAAGNFTAAQYRARWRQLIDYCASLGMYVYATGGSTNEAASLPVAQITASLVELAKEIHGDPWVMGFDVIQESYAFAMANVATVVPAIRAVCDRKLSFSLPVGERWDGDSIYAMNQLRPWVDFYDFHIYYQISNADVDYLFDNSHEVKPIVWGEFGSPVSVGQSAQVARYNAVRDSVYKVRPDGRHIAGALQWAARDQGDDVASQYGMWTKDKVPRQYLIDVFRPFPTIR